MSITNNELVGKALYILRAGLAPFVEQKFTERFGAETAQELQKFQVKPLDPKNPFHRADVAILLKAMESWWVKVFRCRGCELGCSLARTERALANEMRYVRNHWAHQEIFSEDDAYRALDYAHRLLKAIASPYASEIRKVIEEMPPPPGQIWVYDDLAKLVSRIHRETCTYARNRHEPRRPNNYWHGPYASKEAASSPKPKSTVSECKICRP